MKFLQKLHVACGVLGVAVLFSGCQTLRNVKPAEVVSFHYQIVEPIVNPEDNSAIYTVQREVGSGCVSEPRRFEDIARDVQSIGGSLGYDKLYDCATSYFIGGTDAQAIRDNPLIQFGADVSVPTRSRILGNRGVVLGASTEPTGFNIESTGVLNQKTNIGSLEVYFGGGGPVFQCTGGDQPWHTNIHDTLRDKFFEFELTSFDSNANTVSGEFQCLARNMNDPADHRLMIIFGGSFFLKNNID